VTGRRWIFIGTATISAITSFIMVHLFPTPETASLPAPFGPRRSAFVESLFQIVSCKWTTHTLACGEESCPINFGSIQLAPECFL
jgi:hypothetical protein